MEAAARERIVRYLYARTGGLERASGIAARIERAMADRCLLEGPCGAFTGARLERLKAIASRTGHTHLFIAYMRDGLSGRQKRQLIKGGDNLLDAFLDAAERQVDNILKGKPAQTALSENTLISIIHAALTEAQGSIQQITSRPRGYGSPVIPSKVAMTRCRIA